jgi:CubicO group peptidase (beta-lactamase class C family)
MIRRLYPFLLAGALLLLALASNGVTARNRPYPDPDAVDRYIERQMAANRVPGLALAITRGDEAVYLKGYGTSGNGKPVTPRTQFYTASLSKGFTALAVMQLVEEGKAKLDEPVRTYLPGFATADEQLSGKITVRQLLNQTSGLADLIQISTYPAWLSRSIRIKSSASKNSTPVVPVQGASGMQMRLRLCRMQVRAISASSTATAL